MGFSRGFTLDWTNRPDTGLACSRCCLGNCCIRDTAASLERLSTPSWEVSSTPVLALGHIFSFSPDVGAPTTHPQWAQSSHPSLSLFPFLFHSHSARKFAPACTLGTGATQGGRSLSTFHAPLGCPKSKGLGGEWAAGTDLEEVRLLLPELWSRSWGAPGPRARIGWMSGRSQTGRSCLLPCARLSWPVLSRAGQQVASGGGWPQRLAAWLVLGRSRSSDPPLASDAGLRISGRARVGRRAGGARRDTFIGAGSGVGAAPRETPPPGGPPWPMPSALGLGGTGQWRSDRVHPGWGPPRLPRRTPARSLGPASAMRWVARHARRGPQELRPYSLRPWGVPLRLSWPSQPPLELRKAAGRFFLGGMQDASRRSQRCKDSAWLHPQRPSEGHSVAEEAEEKGFEGGHRGAEWAPSSLAAPVTGLCSISAPHPQFPNKTPKGKLSRVGTPGEMGEGWSPRSALPPGSLPGLTRH